MPLVDGTRGGGGGGAIGGGCRLCCTRCAPGAGGGGGAIRDGCRLCCTRCPPPADNERTRDTEKMRRGKAESEVDSAGQASRIYWWGGGGGGLTSHVLESAKGITARRLVVPGEFSAGGVPTRVTARGKSLRLQGRR